MNVRMSRVRRFWCAMLFVVNLLPSLSWAAKEEDGDDAQGSSLETEEKEAKTALDFTSEQIAKASLTREVRVLFAERTSLSAKLKWVMTRKMLQKVVAQIMEKKQELEASEMAETEEPSIENKKLPQAEVALRKSEVDLAEHLLEKVQAEVTLNYEKWQLADIQIDEAQALVNIEKIKSQLNDVPTGGETADLPVQKKQSKRSQKKKAKADTGKGKSELESLLSSEQSQLDDVQKTIEAHRLKISQAELEVQEKQAQIDALHKDFLEISEVYEKIKMEEGHKEPHLRWAGRSGFAVNLQFLSWPTHTFSSVDGIQGMLGGLGLEYNRFAKFKGRYVGRIGADFIVGWDLSRSSFLIGGLAHLEFSYPIVDWFSLGAGVHGGYLAALGGQKQEMLDPSTTDTTLGDRNYGLVGGQVYMRFKTSAMTDFTIFVGGTGLLGPDRSGSLIVGARFSIALPKLEVSDKSSKNKKEEPPKEDAKPEEADAKGTSEESEKSEKEEKVKDQVEKAEKPEKKESKSKKEDSEKLPDKPKK